MSKKRILFFVLASMIFLSPLFSSAFAQTATGSGESTPTKFDSPNVKNEASKRISDLEKQRDLEETHSQWIRILILSASIIIGVTLLWLIFVRTQERKIKVLKGIGIILIILALGALIGMVVSALRSRSALTIYHVKGSVESTDLNKYPIKVVALAVYTQPNDPRPQRQIADVHPDGSFELEIEEGLYKFFATTAKKWDLNSLPGPEENLGFYNNLSPVNVTSPWNKVKIKIDKPWTQDLSSTLFGITGSPQALSSAKSEEKIKLSGQFAIHGFDKGNILVEIVSNQTSVQAPDLKVFKQPGPFSIEIPSANATIYAAWDRENIMASRKLGFISDVLPTVRITVEQAIQRQKSSEGLIFNFSKISGEIICNEWEGSSFMVAVSSGKGTKPEATLTMAKPGRFIFTVPAGAYSVVAFWDVNRDGISGFSPPDLMTAVGLDNPIHVPPDKNDLILRFPKAPQAKTNEGMVKISGRILCTECPDKSLWVVAWPFLNTINPGALSLARISNVGSYEMFVYPGSYMLFAIAASLETSLTNPSPNDLIGYFNNGNYFTVEGDKTGLNIEIKKSLELPKNGYLNWIGEVTCSKWTGGPITVSVQPVGKNNFKGAPLELRVSYPGLFIFPLKPGHYLLEGSWSVRNKNEAETKIITYSGTYLDGRIIDFPLGKQTIRFDACTKIKETANETKQSGEGETSPESEQIKRLCTASLDSNYKTQPNEYLLSGDVELITFPVGPIYILAIPENNAKPYCVNLPKPGHFAIAVPPGKYSIVGIWDRDNSGNLKPMPPDWVGNFPPNGGAFVVSKDIKNIKLVINKPTE